MLSTRAETPRLGTDTLTGFAGLAGTVLFVVEELFVDLGDVALDVGLVGTAVVVPGRALVRLDADGPAAVCCRPSSAAEGLLLSCR
jgi:hypothetical protein